MKMAMRRKFMESWLNKWRKMGSSSSSRVACEKNCYQWGAFWASTTQSQRDGGDERSSSSSIPRDVPKGHLVVYVGEDHKRFVIKIILLKHPLFKALLDQARDVYDFSNNDSKLCIPCEESTFLDVVVRCAAGSALLGYTYIRVEGSF